MASKFLCHKALLDFLLATAIATFLMIFLEEITIFSPLLEGSYAFQPHPNPTFPLQVEVYSKCDFFKKKLNI